jgi:hypothetical protein
VTLKYTKESVMLALESILVMENNDETKLDLLTTIGITTTSDIIFSACEEVRNNLPERKEVRKKKRPYFLSDTVVREQTEDSGGNEERNEDDAGICQGGV